MFPQGSIRRDFIVTSRCCWGGNLGLMVTAKGHKPFVVQYRAGMTPRRMNLKDA
jgi:hypothetical protein